MSVARWIRSLRFSSTIIRTSWAVTVEDCAAVSERKPIRIALVPA